MTIQRARELLGNDVKNLSDEQIMQLNAQTKNMCRGLLSLILNNSNIDISMEEANNEFRN